MPHRANTIRAIGLLVLTSGIVLSTSWPASLILHFGHAASPGSGSTFPPQIQRPPDISVERLDRPLREHPDAGPLIDLNTASLDQLKTLPGVDDTTAQSIIGGRPYRTRDDLVGKRILSEATYETIKDRVTVAPE